MKQTTYKIVYMNGDPDFVNSFAVMEAAIVSMADRIIKGKDYTINSIYNMDTAQKITGGFEINY